ncbi:3-oxoacyl-ACP synthase III family protein [Okeania hirsuta]|uniref:3-oxoacyl-ACP synthase III family protein n=1 Tax=Okeania hirsuta TaxID=1458930 RepID=UPI000F537852|nr:ketoacyl-ACP synthase III [Okeania hirsuta]RQH13347.1 ketoacyl-ACP synthase III [Okeania hirsuta]
MPNAIIASAGAYVPERVLPNSWFNDLLQEDVDTWLKENLHIHERRWCEEGESTADLAERAAQKALENANLEAGEIDLIIVSTDTPEFISPSTATVLQNRLGAQKAGTFDINSACAGFVTALTTAANFIRADVQYRKVLVVGAYAMSKYLNHQDKKTVTLFADGAGAFVLEASEEVGRGFLGGEMRAMGQYNEWMGIYAGGSKHAINPQSTGEIRQQLEFVKRFPKELNPETWEDMARVLSDKIGKKPAEVKQYFITQLNINSIWETMDRLELDRAKAHTAMHQFGYTGSACLPLTYCDAWEKGLINKGDLIYFIGSGGGLAFASAAFKL